DDFLNESGYERKHIKLKQNTYTLSFGYDVILKYNSLSLSPYLGLVMAEIEEDNGKYDPHPNWDLNSKSKFHPYFGLRIKNYLSPMKRFMFSVFLEFSYNKFHFDNEEYGKGKIYNLIIGLSTEFLICRKEVN
ncbi:MAG: hypothetical protein ABIJ12_10915, partial [bacterium]